MCGICGIRDCFFFPISFCYELLLTIPRVLFCQLQVPISSAFVCCSIRSGVADIRHYLNKKIKVGLGTGKFLFPYYLVCRNQHKNHGSDFYGVGWGVLLLSYRLMGMCRWMGSHIHNWINCNEVTFLIELMQ